MVINFFLISAYQSAADDVTVFADLSGLFPIFMENWLVFFSIILACLGVSAGEILLRYKQDQEE